MPNDRKFDAVVIGGGFFGCEIAGRLAKRHDSVAVFEAGPDLLTRASYANQARIHGGYHYPRSVLTASRSRANYPRFLADYPEAVADGVITYYAVASRNSHVTGEQFRTFMERVGAPLGPAPAEVKDLFDPEMVEAVFAVEESVFDALALRRLMRERLPTNVEVFTNTPVERAERGWGGRLRLVLGDGRRLEAGQAFLCAYSRINNFLQRSRLPLIPMKHELAEMPLVSAPPAFRGLGLTVMCGPFFSLMPFPPAGPETHSLSHVRYTPHHEWLDSEGFHVDPYDHLGGYSMKSRYPEMVRDAARYIPALAGTRPLGQSLWEVKTVLPASEEDDSRPILMRRDHGIEGLHCVLGAKIDNIYDVLEMV